MKCDKTFITAYNDLFKCLHKHGGEQEVVDFWEILGDAILQRLKYLAKTEGLVGMLKYWSETLSYEGAHFQIELTSGGMDSDALYIRMYKCPSLAHLGDDAYVKYCDHCDILYVNALAECGYSFKKTKYEKQGCQIWITKILS